MQKNKNNFLSDFSWLKQSKKRQNIAKTIVFTMKKQNFLTKKILLFTKKITKKITKKHIKKINKKITASHDHLCIVRYMLSHTNMMVGGGTCG